MFLFTRQVSHPPTTLYNYFVTKEPRILGSVHLTTTSPFYIYLNLINNQFLAVHLHQLNLSLMHHDCDTLKKLHLTKEHNILTFILYLHKTEKKVKNTSFNLVRHLTSASLQSKLHTSEIPRLFPVVK